VTQANIYDNADRLRSVVYTHASHGTIASAAYTLDQVGNRLTMADLDGTTTYTYDKLHRLKTVAYPGGELVTYNYDAMGNRTSMVSSVAGTTSYSYDAADRLTSFTAPGGSTALTWDANGNMIGKGSASYSFDALDRLTRVVSSTTTVQFSYNGDGVRVGKTVNGATTSYLQDTAAPLPVVAVETTGGQASRYIYGSDLLTLIDAAGAPVFYHTDGLGSTRALSNQAGQRTDRYSYDVFGATRSHVGASSQVFGFTGEQLDEELGLMYLRARYFNPQTGRFVSNDPWPGQEDAIQTLNGYAYASNTPLTYVDPSGATLKEIGDKLAEKGKNIVYNVTHPGEYVENMKIALSDPIARGFVLDELSENSKLVGYGSCAVGFAPGCAVFVKGAYVTGAVNAVDTLRGLSAGEVPTGVAVDRGIRMGTSLVVGKVVDKYVAGTMGEAAWRYGTRYFGTVTGGQLGQFASYGVKEIWTLSGINGYLSGMLSDRFMQGLGFLGQWSGSSGGTSSGSSIWGGPPSGGK
jgi:RHS repeat-associated protein